MHVMDPQMLSRVQIGEEGPVEFDHGKSHLEALQDRAHGADASCTGKGYRRTISEQLLECRQCMCGKCDVTVQQSAIQV